MGLTWRTVPWLTGGRVCHPLAQQLPADPMGFKAQAIKEAAEVGRQSAFLLKGQQAICVYRAVCNSSLHGTRQAPRRKVEKKGPSNEWLQLHIPRRRRWSADSLLILLRLPHLPHLLARALGLRMSIGVAIQAHLRGVLADAAQREDARAAHARGVHRLTLHGHGEVQRRRRRDAFHGDSRELRELGVRRRQPALHRVAPQLVHLVGGGIQRRLEAVQVLATLL
mmetsp:Transcript_15335/g.49249  ORF Transcript_15335/g.49249 Transcript_15335/m.49249 type:complete len:224 (-) Transcript_15335:1026-1697(-)